MTYKELAEIAGNLKKTDIKGKKYTEVAERINGFRMLCPNGTIETELIRMDGDKGKRTAVMKAVVRDEFGTILATGMAYEDEENGMVNKTSFLENCETSAVGRALGFLGLDMESVASADEVERAQAIQTANSKINAAKQKALTAHLEECGVDIKDVLPLYKVLSVADITERMHENIITHIADIKARINEG